MHRAADHAERPDPTGFPAQPRGGRSEARRPSRRAGGRPRPERCEACKLPPSRCECSLLPRARPEMRILLVRHAREEKIFCGTGGLVLRVLEGSALAPYGDLAAPLDLRILDDPGIAWHVLYPSPGATVLTRDLRDRSSGRRLGLVIPDGSWPQARKMVQRVPALHGLPFVRLPEVAAARYRLRTAPRPGQVGTAEAVLRALEILGDRPAASALRAALEVVADRVLRTRGKRSAREDRTSSEPR